MKTTYIKATKQIKSETPKTGEPIEIKVARLLSQEEPIKDQVPLIYTERKKGVQPEYNIRTDRFEIALEAMDKVSSSMQAKREERMKESASENKGEPKGQSTAE